MMISCYINFRLQQQLLCSRPYYFSYSGDTSPFNRAKSKKHHLFIANTQLLGIFIWDGFKVIRESSYNISMGKKGVLLDNGKTAQSSMALYWKAGQKKSASSAGPKVAHEEKEVNIEDRAGSGMQKWKMHKEKLISKLYSKPQKKAEASKQDEEQKQRKIEQQLDRDLLEREMNKHKPKVIPGFSSAKQLDSKRQFQTVVPGKQESNKLILPAGYEGYTEEDLLQILREKKAKRDLEHNKKNRLERATRVMVVQSDLLLGEDEQKPPEPQKIPEPEEKPIIVEQEKSIFKSQLLQKIEKGESLVPKHSEPAIVVEEPAQAPERPEMVPRFIPRALWKK